MDEDHEPAEYQLRLLVTWQLHATLIWQRLNGIAQLNVALGFDHVARLGEPEEKMFIEALIAKFASTADLERDLAEARQQAAGLRREIADAQADRDEAKKSLNEIRKEMVGLKAYTGYSARRSRFDKAWLLFGLLAVLGPWLVVFLRQSESR